MFGNGPGWVLSGILVVAAGWFIFHMRELDQPSPPGEFGRNAGSYTISLPVEPKSLMSEIMPTRSTDGGSLYREAIKLYEANPKPYDRLIEQNGVVPLPDQKALDKIIEATGCESADIFQSTPELLITKKGSGLELAAEELITLKQAGLLVAQGHKEKGNKNEAIRIYKALFTLGVHLFRERLTVEELRGGLEMLAASSSQLAVLEPEKAARYSDFLKGVSAANKQFQTVRERIKVLDKTDPKTGRAVERQDYTADMRAVAENTDCDHVWRVQAVLALARMKYSAARYGDQMAAKRVLRHLQKADDPVLAYAARIAEEQTMSDLQGSAR